MIRSSLAPRPLRVAAALTGVAGAVLLAGCSTTATTSAEDDTAVDATVAATEDSAASTGAADSSDAASGSTYTDGEYTAEGSYSTPESVETISVTITLESDVITAVSVEGDPTNPESEQYQSEFIGGIEGEVVGKDIDDISVSRVAGSSLTSGGFNDAVETIKSEAAA